MNDELFDWFEESFGSTECYDLIDGNPINKPVACREILESTYLKLLEMFEYHGIKFKSEL